MTDVLELLRREDPVDLPRLRAEEPPQDRLEAILATSPGGPREPGATRMPRRRRSPVRALLPAGAAAAIVGVALMLIGGDGRSVDSAAAAALHRIAGVARAQPPTLPPGDPRFLYARLQGEGFMAMAGERPFHRGIESADDFGFLLHFRHTQEVWVGESSGVVRNTATAPTFATEGDRRVWEAAGRPKLPPANDDEFPLGQGIERLRIPTDPDELLAHLERRAGEEDEGAAYIFATLITDYLREWGVTPAQRAALFEAAARLPGVQLLGRRTDPAGRAGVGFAVDDEREHSRQTLILDPDTGELLAEISETLPGGPIPPRARSYTTFSSPVLVDAPGERPR